MIFVVTDDCTKCKYTDCVEVCPIDYSYEGPNFLVIHPDGYIDCALYKSGCPTQAILSEDEVPENIQEFIELNNELAGVWLNIIEKKSTLPDVEGWDGVTGESQHLECWCTKARKWRTFSLATSKTADKKKGWGITPFTPQSLVIVLTNRFPGDVSSPIL